jgi:hypothetical protein
MLEEKSFAPAGDRTPIARSFHNMYSSPNTTRKIKSRGMRWAGHVALMERGEKVYKVLVGRPKGKRRLERSRHRLEDGIKMDLGETGCWGMEWIQLAQDMDRWRAVVNTVMNLRVVVLQSEWVGE